MQEDMPAFPLSKTGAHTARSTSSTALLACTATQLSQTSHCIIALEDQLHRVVPKIVRKML